MIHLPDPDSQPQFYRSVPTKRLIAWLVDATIVLLLSCLIVVFTAFTGLFVWPLLYLAVDFVYRTVTLSNGSATWGMRLVGIEFRTATGDRFDTGYAAMHTGGTLFSFAFPILQVISVGLMLTSPRGQGLTDMALGTTALNRRAPALH